VGQDAAAVEERREFDGGVVVTKIRAADVAERLDG